MAFLPKAKIKQQFLSVKTEGKTDGSTTRYKCKAVRTGNARRAMGTRELGTFKWRVEVTEKVA